MSFNIIPPQVPFTGKDGRIAREWYLFLLNLFQSNGSGNNALTQDQFETLMLAGARSPNTSGIESALREIAAAVQTQHSERSTIESIIRRVADLEAQDRGTRLAPAGIDPRQLAELQTFTFGSRPWL